jgi:hypothetical protein
MPANYHVPTTSAELKPPKASSLITEAASFQRAHWEELKPFWQAISGEVDSIHGSVQFDEAACAFKAKEIAATNGYAYLGSIPTAAFWRAMRFGFKRNTGMTVGRLEKQYKQIQLEHRQQQET